VRFAGLARLGPSALALVAAGVVACGAGPDASPRVPGGTYARTYVNDGNGPTGAADPARVSELRLDRYLISVGRFRQFVAASAAGWTPMAGAGRHAHLNHGQGLASGAGAGYEPGWSAADASQLATTAGDWAARLNCEPSFHTWTDAAGPNESLPINCIDWYDAYAFCIWDGGFLPSEAEWGYAAAGGDQQRAYPWGATDPAGSSHYLISGCNYPPGSTACSGVTNLAPIGTATMGAGRWGQLDLAGELSEWTLDWYAPYANPCADCANLTDFSYRVLRGGSFGTDTDNIFPAARNGDVPPARNAFYGARCARAP